MLKTYPDCSKEIAAGAKSKPATKMSNGLSAKRKVNEAECREPSSTSKKLPTDGGNDSGLQKRKVIRMGTAAQQRPKSAPAAMSKKQGVSGDRLDVPKSVSSKQTDVKMEAKLVNHSVSGDKPVSVNKKATKPSVTSANKTNAGVPSNKQSLSNSKPSISNPKESKPKAQSNSKPLSLNQKSHQKSSSSAVKKCQNLVTNNAESNDVKESASQQLAERAENLAQHCSEGQPFTVPESCQENSMSNQDFMIQKPNLEHCQCQENLPAASVLRYASNSKEGLSEATNQTKTANVDNAGSGKVYIISTAGEKKPDCKNICDSENSKCADSSSESELCSVKEVERIPKQEEREDVTLFQFSQNTNRVAPSYNAAESPSMGDSTSCQPALNNSEPCMNCSSEKQLSKYQTEINATEAADHENFEFIGQWNKHSGMLHERESPESESGSASTSSDDIKPRSEDYDAGGSQDDDGSNERGISKCSTMRCHDFLGRSSSDTSTPEELKGYDGSLRVDVKLKKDSTELFRVNSTSDDEGPQKKNGAMAAKGCAQT
ncbi:unnamed protein product [Staurois parvus]|uniref:Breast cancer protein 1 n=1 Tax=Staurois parvus TaxID=386267 RepID=A0ABN9HHU9_9NEOB|nr:unnamed protein product [Staurois parvus]